jgi:predicted ATPase/class 3 adenylate cyclase
MADRSAADDIQNLKAAIAALEAQRGVLGDAVLEAALKPLRQQLAALTTPPDERKRVTILFADVSGFTAMSERLDPEDVTIIMNRCFEQLSSEIVRYGGTVDKYEGDAVMALFGAPQALENHEEMAVRAALAMQKALTSFSAKLERERGFTLRMRIGLNTGEVLAGLVGGVGDKSYTVMGDAVNLAARLEHACTVGRVMISAETARPLHTVFDFEPPQQITVKGKADPLTVYLVVGPKMERGRVRGLAGFSAPMIGRESELTALQSAYERALSERRWRAVAVVGEAGIGKTRLRREFLAWIARQYPETRILTGRCYTHTQATPYYLVGELTQTLFAIGRDDDVAVALAGLRKKLETLSGDIDGIEFSYRLASLAAVLGLPLENDPLLGLEPQQRRNRIFLSLERIWIDLFTSSPTIIVAEDLHWADDLSLTFLNRFLETVERPALSDQSVLLLVVSRLPEDPLVELKQLLTRLQQPPHRVLALRSLTETQAGHLMVELLGQADELDRLGSLIAARALGNPFFVEELVRSFIEDGALVYDERTATWQMGRPVTDIQVPKNVQGVLAARLDRLPPEDKRVAQHAAIVGRTFWQRLLTKITDQSVSTPLTRMEERQMVMRLTESQIADDWEWLFRHVLVQEVAYASVTKAVRRGVHRKVAEWLEEHAGDRIESFVPLIAYHYERAQARAKALHYLTLAAEQAARAFDNYKAVEFSTRALELTKDDATRFNLLSRRQEIYGQMGARDEQWADLQEMLGLAEKLDDDHHRAQTLNNMGLVVRRRRDLDGALASHQQALTLFRQVGDRVGEGRCLNNIGNIHWQRGETREAQLYYEQALRLASQTADRRDEGNYLNNLGGVCWQTGDYGYALQFYRQALQIHRETEDRYNESISHTNVGEVHRRLGNYDQALADFGDALSICRAIGDQEGELYVLHQLGLTCTDSGQGERALQHHRDGMRLARQMGNKSAEADAWYGAGVAYLQQRDLIEALDALEHAHVLHEELEQHDGLIADLCAMSRVHLAAGRTVDAVECSTRAIALLEGQSHQTENAPQIYYQHYRALLAGEVLVEHAPEHLDRAYDLLMQQADRINGASSRRSFLEDVAIHREIVREASSLTSEH